MKYDIGLYRKERGVGRNSITSSGSQTYRVSQKGISEVNLQSNYVVFPHSDDIALLESTQKQRKREHFKSQ